MSDNMIEKGYPENLIRIIYGVNTPSYMTKELLDKILKECLTDFQLNIIKRKFEDDYSDLIIGNTNHIALCDVQKTIDECVNLISDFELKSLRLVITNLLRDKLNHRISINGRDASSVLIEEILSGIGMSISDIFDSVGNEKFWSDVSIDTCTIKYIIDNWSSPTLGLGGVRRHTIDKIRLYTSLFCNNNVIYYKKRCV